MNIKGIYTPKDTALILDISDSSLRKWCIALEKQNYFFDRTDNKKRLFTDNDIIVLKHLKNLIQVQSLGLDNAAIVVASKYKDTSSMASVQTNDNNGERELKEDISYIKEEMERIKTINKELVDILNEQQMYIKDRDQKILEALKDSQENKKLLLEVREEQQKQNKKGWKTWFKKD